MLQAIGQILPIALAVALSSVPIMITIYILLSPERSRAALPFAIGWVIGLVIVVSVCTVLAQLVPTPRVSQRPETTLGILQMLVGVALVVIGIFSFRRARRSGDAGVPKIFQLKTVPRPWESFALAFILNLRPKALLLAIAGGLTIRGETGSVPEAVVVIAIYTLIGASTVVGPIIATLVAPTRMEPRLTSSRDWLMHNGEAMTSLIVVMIGVVIVGIGLARF